MRDARLTLNLTTVQRRAASASCRAADADLFFAAHFLRRDARSAVHVIAAVERTLDKVMTSSGCEGQGQCQSGGSTPCSGSAESHEGHATGCGAKNSSAAARGEKLGAASDCGQSKSSPASTCSSASGGCGSEGQTPEVRREVCSSVLAHLFSGQPTGRPELDGFPAVAKAFDLERDEFESYCDGVTAMLPLKRVATWARLRGLCERTGGSLALIASRVLTLDTQVLKDDAWRARAVALATAVQLTRLLSSIGDDWSRQRLLLPMDDLVTCGLTPTDVSTFHAHSSAGDDARWRRLMNTQVERAHRLFDGGQTIAPELTPDARRAVSVFAQVHRTLLDRLADGRANPFAPLCPLGLLDRLTLLPGAISAAAR